MKDLETRNEQHKSELSVLGAENESLTSQLQAQKEATATADQQVRSLTEELSNVKVQ